LVAAVHRTALAIEVNRRYQKPSEQLAEKKTHMKIKIKKYFSAFTLIELLVVIAIIAILAAFAVPALTSALTKGQMTGTMNNARQLYIAQFQMSNDGAATSDATSAWPGDLPTVPPDLISYLNVLCQKGYLRGADALKLMTAPGAAFTANVTTTGGVDSLDTPGGTAALKVWLVQDANPATEIFCTTRNYVYNTALVPTDSPYGSRGFITVKKGGDAAIYRVGQAQAGGWTNGTLFQNSVGYKSPDTIGTPQVGDPTTPGTGTVHFP